MTRSAAGCRTGCRLPLGVLATSSSPLPRRIVGKIAAQISRSSLCIANSSSNTSPVKPRTVSGLAGRPIRRTPLGMRIWSAPACSRSRPVRLDVAGVDLQELAVLADLEHQLAGLAHASREEQLRPPPQTAAHDPPQRQGEALAGLPRPAVPGETGIATEDLPLVGQQMYGPRRSPPPNSRHPESPSRPRSPLPETAQDAKLAGCTPLPRRRLKRYLRATGHLVLGQGWPYFLPADPAFLLVFFFSRSRSATSSQPCRALQDRP